jgi:hypothetical protein
MVIVPVELPLVIGLKVTVRTADWPLDSVVPPGTPLTMNAELEADTPETVTLALPLFVRVEVWVLLLPRATSPKLRAAGFAVSPYVGVVVVVLEAMTPEQPVRPTDSKRAIMGRLTNGAVLRFFVKNRAAIESME